MLDVKNITKAYQAGDREHVALRDVSFSVNKGEVVCILGHSGSGKSTLLRSLASLESIDVGKIERDPHVVSAYVSQQYTLWPHLTVLENLTLAPSLTKDIPIDMLNKEAGELLSRFGLADQADAYPSHLSGGQRQRVALLRAIMTKPDLLFLDEITSALDPELTKGVLDLIRVLAKDGYTMMIVTHHMSFALAVSDRILFMKNGELVANETTATFFVNQSNPEIQSFIVDIARRDENIQVFKGREQFQAYHLNLIKRLPEHSTIYVAGGVSDRWYEPMGDLYPAYEKTRHERNIIWKMVTYKQGEIERRLLLENPTLNIFKKMPDEVKNPANYIVFGDTVATQIFEEEPTIIEIRNPNIAQSYKRFFDELWRMAK